MIRAALTLAVMASIQGCSLLPGLGGETVTGLAPTEPSRITQLGYGKDAKFGVCTGKDCPQRTAKTLAAPVRPVRLPMFIAPKPTPTPEPASPALPPPLPENRTVTVVFPFGKSTLDAEAMRVITGLQGEARKAQKITVTGYTDWSGSRLFNDRLAQSRAESVKALLVNGEVQADVINVAKGMCCYAGSNRSKKGRAANRRVTVEILFKENK